MRHYELMVILDPSLEERTVAPSLDTFLNVIRNDGGTRREGRRVGPAPPRLRDQQERRGHLRGLDLQAEPAAVAELDRQLSLNESVLRTKVLRPEPKRARRGCRELRPPWQAKPSSPSSAT